MNPHWYQRHMQRWRDLMKRDGVTFISGQWVPKGWQPNPQTGYPTFHVDLGGPPAVSLSNR